MDTKPKKYRKKPVVIEALQFQMPVSVSHILDFCQGKASISTIGAPLPIIHTMEGDMTVNPGDYVIRGIKGEFYPCKPDIFEATYEVVG